MGGGTTEFPDLGRHCEQDDCHQLDFLPFKCDGCQKVFCLEHRSHKAHGCPKADHESRIVVVCEVCSAAMEKKGEDESDEHVLTRHQKSGDCDPAKKKKSRCPVKRCKEKLNFSNTITCKTCHQKLCLKHRFPGEHPCQPNVRESMFLLTLDARSGGKDCGDEQKRVSSSSPPPPSPHVEAC